MKPINSANNISGTLCRTFNGTYFLRVVEGDSFKDYFIAHSDMTIQILDDDAWFYKTENGDLILDHSPETLGISHDKS